MTVMLGPRKNSGIVICAVTSPSAASSDTMIHQARFLHNRLLIFQSINRSIDRSIDQSSYRKQNPCLGFPKCVKARTVSAAPQCE